MTESQKITLWVFVALAILSVVAFILTNRARRTTLVAQFRNHPRIFTIYLLIASIGSKTSLTK